MNIKMAFLFNQAVQQAALPSEQRTMSLEQVCKVADIQMGKYEVGPYLEAMKDEIEISYPQDILAIISERKKTVVAGPDPATGAQNDVTPDPALPSAQSLLGTSEPPLNSAPSTFNQPKNSSDELTLCLCNRTSYIFCKIDQCNCIDFN